MPVRYKELVLDGGYRLDLLIDDAIIVELKAVETVLPVHHRCDKWLLRPAFVGKNFSAALRLCVVRG